MTDVPVAAVADAGATLKRCLALVRLYHPDHDAVKELATQAGQKLKAILSTFAPITLAVDAKSMSFHGKPVLVDEGTELAVSTLFADGVASVSFSAAVDEAAVVSFVRLWGKASDKRNPLPADQTFSTLIWEAALPGVSLAFQQEEAAADLEQQAAMARRQQLHARLQKTQPLPPAPPAAAAAVPDVDVNNVLGPLLQGSLQALPAVAGDAPTLLALLGKSVATEIRKDAAAVAASFATLVQGVRAQVVSNPGLVPHLEALLSCLAGDEVRAALVQAATTDAAGVAKLVRYIPRKHIAAVAALLTSGASKEIAVRLGELNIQEQEWPALLAACGDDGAEALFQVARTRSPKDGVAVVRAAEANEAVFVSLLGKLRGPEELEPARALLHAALARPSSAHVAEEALVKLKDPAVLPRVAQKLNDEARPVEQRKHAALALTRFDGDGGKAALRAAFGTVKSDEVKSAIASALATARDQSARPMLEAVAKKLIVDRGLKKACEDAVKRLEQAS